MSTVAATAALVLIILALAFLIAAIIIAAYRDGSLQADVRWVRAYIRTEFAHYKYTRQN
jgi:membrane-bound metal-dependent hydrolase YbcI (DUF457 family)